jgi:hypothetical protein
MHRRFNDVVPTKKQGGYHTRTRRRFVVGASRFHFTTAFHLYVAQVRVKKRWPALHGSLGWLWLMLLAALLQARAQGRRLLLVAGIGDSEIASGSRAACASAGIADLASCLASVVAGSVIFAVATIQATTTTNYNFHMC